MAVVTLEATPLRALAPRRVCLCLFLWLPLASSPPPCAPQAHRPDRARRCDFIRLRYSVLRAYNKSLRAGLRRAVPLASDTLNHRNVTPTEGHYATTHQKRHYSRDGHHTDIWADMPGSLLYSNRSSWPALLPSEEFQRIAIAAQGQGHHSNPQKHGRTASGTRREAALYGELRMPPSHRAERCRTRPASRV